MRKYSFLCMDCKHVSLLYFLSFHILLAHISVTNSSLYNSLCTQTPYQELCSSLINTYPKISQVENVPDFRDFSIIETLARAQNAHNLISSMDLSSFNEFEKSAWVDCLELYDDTIYQLNRSIGSNIDALHVQTWLSASIANDQTCQNGFLDFNMSSPFDQSISFLLSNFSKFLSNSLAINKAMTTLYNSNNLIGNRRLLAGDGFPEWVSAGDRRMLQSSGGATATADIVVAQDGSGDFKTISEGVVAATKQRVGTKRFVIYVKKGIYKENVVINRSVKNLMFIGDGIDATIVTGGKSVQDGSTTFRSATFAVSGDGFIAQGMTFENSAGPQKHQAVALRSGSDFSVFYQCSFKGYQDTLYVYAQRQFYRDCDIFGTIDFVFGDAVSVLQNCKIYIRKPMSNQINTVTAQGRKDPNENTGIVIHNSHVMSESTLGSTRSYLGRPWQRYSRTIFMKCTIDGIIDPAGWLPWSGDFALSTLFYGEYFNTGGGASTTSRVKWPGFRVITSATEAGKFSVENFLAGSYWIPATGVPFTASL